MKPKSKKIMFFGFDIKKETAKIIGILGIILMIFTLIGLGVTFWYMYEAYLVYHTYSTGSTAGYFSYSVLSWLPSVVITIGLLILASYMIQTGNKAKK